MPFNPDKNTIDAMRQGAQSGGLRILMEQLQKHREIIKEQLIVGSEPSEEMRLRGEARLVRELQQLFYGE